jgi:4-hydroxy-tetrahydrodipicolinate synthase
MMRNERTSPFHGVVPYIVTPLDETGQVNADAVYQLCEDLIKAGVHGIAPLGSTGEYPYLSDGQRSRMVEVTIAAVAGRVPVFAGVASLSVDGARCQAKTYARFGVDGIVIALDAYFPLDEAETCDYFWSVADAVDLPVAIYTNPNFQRSSLSINALEKLSRHSNISAIKDASTNTGRLLSILNRCEGRLDVLAASSHIPLCVMMLGGKGWFSGPACLIPRQSVALYELCIRQEWSKALCLQKKLWPVNEMFAQYNLASCIKAGLQELGYQVGNPILPQWPLSSDARAEILSILRAILSESGPGRDRSRA